MRLTAYTLYTMHMCNHVMDIPLYMCMCMYSTCILYVPKLLVPFRRTHIWVEIGGHHISTSCFSLSAQEGRGDTPDR